jgi:hypothetical protein
MLQIERSNDKEEALRVALKGLSASLWTALPGIVESYDPAKGTCRVQPAIKGRVRADVGTYSFVTLPLLTDVPVIFMGGGQFVATFPIQSGDEALVIFADRCIDGWWQSGGVQPQAELRMHSLSDGFALIGPRSQAKKLSNVSTTTAQFRTVDGSTYVEVAGGNVVNIVALGGVNITGPLNITGDVAVTGKVTAIKEGKFNNVSVSTHIHSGVQTGGSNTGAPVT